MRIGIDIDNVISNFNEMLLETYLIHDKELRNTGIINPNAKYIRTGMFDWSNEEELSFYKDNIEGIAKEYIDRLHNDGHLIYIITGRDNGEYSEPYNMTKKWLDENNIYYDNLILTDAYDIHAKSLECLKNDIDIMIDDSVRICSDLITSGITTILMDTPYNRKINIKRVKNWEEFYEFVSSYKENK